MWNKIPACAAALLAGLTLISSAQAAIVFGNDITGTNPSSSNPFTAGQTVDSHITVSGIGFGSGATANAANDRYNLSNLNSAALDANDYFTFTLTPSTGFKLNLTDFVYTAQRSSTGASSFAFRSSLDSYVASLGTPTSTGATIDLSAAAYQGLTAPITFRLYAWGATATSGTFSVNDFHFDGTTAATPEPATLALSGLAAMGLLTRRRR